MKYIQEALKDPIFWVVVTVAVFALWGNAHAADIVLQPCGHDCARVSVRGQINPGDSQIFFALVRDTKTATVDLESKGGDAKAGFAIGEIIHDRGFDTNVPAGKFCASSCANIWLAGHRKTLGAGASLLWHSAYVDNDKGHADGSADALTGMYLAHMGYGYDTAQRLIGHDPNVGYAEMMIEGELVTKAVSWNGTEWSAK